MHTIEIDDEVMHVLKEAAEPFVDTPNAVLRRLLLDLEGSVEAPQDAAGRSKVAEGRPRYNARRLPKALQQILDVVREVCTENKSRVEATHVVADRHSVAFQTVLDKYCRQLDLEAADFDALLAEPSLDEIEERLRQKFPLHQQMISQTLAQLNCRA